MPLRVFLDASVLFSAAYSAKGAARELLLLGHQRKVALIVSELVLEETRRNLHGFAPDTLPLLDRLLDAIPFWKVQPTKSEVLLAAKYTELKDAAIVAAAIRAKADYLTTFDRQHLINPVEVSQQSGLTIVTPDIVVAAVHDKAHARAA